MATTFTEGVHQSEYLLSEVGTISHQVATVTVADETALVSGTVLGKITATGKYVVHDDAATNGSQDAVAILNTPLPGVADDYQAKIHVRLCEVDGELLSVNTADVRASLAAQDIIVR